MDTSLKSGLLEMSRGLLCLALAAGLLALSPFMILYHYLYRKFS